VAVYSTNEANKAGLKQSIFLDVYGLSAMPVLYILFVVKTADKCYKHSES